MITPPYQVDAGNRKAYEEDGVVCLRNVIPTEQCEHMLEAADAYLKRGEGRIQEAKAAEGGPRLIGAVFMSAIDSEFREFSHRSALPSVAAQLMGVEEVRFFYDQMFIKEPGTLEPVPWHNDLPFWPMQGSHLVSLWVALTKVTKDSSAVEYLAGSHKSGTLYQAVGPGGMSIPAAEGQKPCPNYFDYSLRRADQRFLSWDMEPGDVLCHHPLTAHGSDANHSKSQLRVGLSIRYLGSDVRWDPRLGTMKIVPRSPDVQAGDYPADDDVFPLLQLRT